MGAEKSKPQGGKQSRFTEKEQKGLTQLFSNITNQPDVSKGAIVSPDNVKNIFAFNEELSKKFYDWLTTLTTGKSPKITFEVFTSAIEYMTKSKSNYLYEGFNKKKMTSIEILCAIMFFSQEWATVSFDKITFTRENCTLVINYLLSIFGVESEKVASAVINQVFKYEEDQNQITAEHFFYKVQGTLQYINRVLIEYWGGFVYQGIKQISCPKFTEPSEIITNDFLPILYSHNSSVQQAKGLYLLYSSSTSGISFNRLAFAIIGYNAPTLLVIKHKEVNKETNESSTHIIGAYHAEQWYPQLKYQGDTQTYLFSLSPSYRTFNSYDGQGSSNYAYLNNRHIERSKYKVGLGFGGNDDYNQFRFWIDDDIQASSYVKTDDKTFGSGAIIANNRQQTKLDVICLEIWGIGSEENLMAQFEYRENERREIEKMRKVDKKALWDNDFNKEMLFGKLNAHKDQLREEITRDDEKK